MTIYYYAGNEALNFFYEMLPLIDELRKRGHKVEPINIDCYGLERECPVFSNVPSDVLWSNFRDHAGKRNFYQIVRSTDTVYNPKWTFKDAYKVCVACQYEYDALKEYLGKEKVELTGIPYLDHYAKKDEWKRKDIKEFIPEDEKYIIGIQISHQAHSATSMDYGSIFMKDYYLDWPKKLPEKVVFKTHQNHKDDGWDRPDYVKWIEAHHSFSPEILGLSEGIYSDHFSSMLLEATMIDKPIYIHPPSDAWMKMRKDEHYDGWWSDFSWWELENEKRRKEVSSWFPPYGTNSKRIADLIESCA